MLPTSGTGFRLYEFAVVPAENTIVGPDGRRILRPATMNLLLALVSNAGEVIGPEQQLQAVSHTGSDDPGRLAGAIEELRACFGDRSSRFIELGDDGGARLVAPVTTEDDYVFETESGPIHVRPLGGSDSGEFLLETKSGPVVLHPVREEPRGDLFRWGAELKRRRVFRAVAAYAVVAWLILQIVDVLSGALPVPDWTLTATALTLAIGFPIAAIFAWVFQLTPVGVVPKGEEAGNDIAIDRSRLVHHIDLVIIAILLCVVAFLTWGKVFPTLGEDEFVPVAVMPFENLDSDPNNGYLGAGIADDIRSRLHDVPQLRIAARSSSIALSGKDFDVKVIGDRLNVSHVLEGTYRRIGDRVRLNVQLVDVDSGYNQWTKTYDTTIDDVLDLQTRISLVVTSELRVVLTRELREVLAHTATENPVAFDLYLRASNYLDLPRTDENLQQALVLFREAAREDANFALAYAGLCRTWIERYMHTGDTAFVPDAESNCATALELDSSLAEVHTAMGRLYLITGELDDAEVSFRNAVDIDSREADALVGLGDVYARSGDAVDAELQYRLAIDTQPGNWSGYDKYARFLLRQGRLDEALENYESTVELAPDNANGYNNLGVVHYLLGDFESAADSYRRSLEFNPSRGAYSNTGSMYYYAGDFEQAAAMFARALDETETDYRLWGNLADAQRFDGTEDEGEAAYRRAIELANLQLEVNPRNAEILTNLAWYHANLGDDDTARATLETARSLGGSDPGQAYIAGLAYVLLGETELAAEALDEATSLGIPMAMLEATPELADTDFVDQ